MNNGFVGSIDTDAAIGTILSHFSTDYVHNVIGDSLQMKFRPFADPMANMVDVLERQFLSVSANSLDYKQKISEVRVETYKEIIKMICDHYNLQFVGDFDSMNPEMIHGIAHTMYDIFVSRFTDYMINFFVSYIVNNADSIVNYLKMDETTNKPKDSGLYQAKNFVDEKFIMIHANVNKVIYNMAAYDIPLQVLLSYFLNQQLAVNLGSLIIDTGDIYKNHYASYILDNRYSANLLTNIKLKLQARTQEAIQI